MDAPYNVAVLNGGIMKNIDGTYTPKDDTCGMDVATTDQSSYTVGSGDPPAGVPVVEDEHQSLVDLEAIGQLKALIGQEGMDELLEILFESTPQHLAGLYEAVQKSDRKTLYSISHVMKSSSGTLGLVALFDQCKTLSGMSRKMSMIEAQHRVDAVEETYGRTATFLLQNCFGQKEEG